MAGRAKSQDLLLFEDSEDEDEDNIDTSRHVTVRRIALENDDQYGIWRRDQPKNMPELRPVDILARDLARNSDALQELLTALQITRHQPPSPLRLPKGLNEARFKPRTSPLIQVHSVYQVLGTAELVERILLDVPARTIIFCRAVNKMFRNTIDHSKAIQQALFRIQIPDIPLSQEPKLNPFLENIGKVVDWPISPWTTVKRIDAGGQLRTSTCRFEILSMRISPPLSGRNDYTVHLSVKNVYWRSDWDREKVDKEWCDMLLCQPPRPISVFYDTGQRFILTAKTLGEAIEELKEKIDLRRQSVWRR